MALEKGKSVPTARLAHPLASTVTSHLWGSCNHLHSFDGLEDSHVRCLRPRRRQRRSWNESSAVVS